MENLLDKVNQDLIIAQKSRDSMAVSTLRLLLADVKNAQIAKGKDLTNEELIDQIQKSAKRHKESIEAYQKGGRADLVNKEKAELELLNKYLPSQLSDEEIAKVVDDVISSSGASGVSDMGRVMGEVMAKVKGRADGNVVSKIVRSRLNVAPK